MEIITLDTPSLGDRSYVAIADDVAVVIDPQRDIDRVLATVHARGARITHVLETHIHNDYVTGGYALAERTGADYVLNAADEVSFDRRGVEDGDVLEAGPMRIRVIATPGHTFTHLSYAVEVNGQVAAVFTGGSLLYGSTGRPDLLGDGHAEQLARAQYHSAQRLLDELPELTPIKPTHGFGSFCSATQTEGDASTLAREAISNPVLLDDEEAFVNRTLTNLDAYPAYYAHMAPANSSGPAAPDLSPPAPADADEIRERIERGEWVVDLRSRTAFAANHVPGTISIGLDGSFVTYLGWLIPWGTPITLLGGTWAEVAQAQRELVRIGIDRPAAAATGTPARWSDGHDTTTLRTTDFTELAARRKGGGSPFVLDVRLTSEHAEEHLEGSIHVPLHELMGRLDELPDDGTVWVHCRSGYRASIAASLLQRAGREVVLIDDEFERAAHSGLEVSSDSRLVA